MQIITTIFRSFAFLGLCAWFCAWLVSAILNFRFGFLVAGGTASALLFALLLFCLDIAKGALQLTILQEMRLGRHPSFLFGFLYCAAALSFYIAVSNIMATRVQGSDQNDAVLTASNEVSGSINRLKKERDNLGSPRSKEELETEKQRFQRSSLWQQSSECSSPKGQSQNKFCDNYSDLQMESAKRDRLESLNEKLGTLTETRNEKGVVSDADPLTTLLAGFLRFSGTEDISLQKQLIYISLAILIACLVEIWSSFGLLWMGRAFGYDLLAYMAPQMPAISTQTNDPHKIQTIDITKAEARKLVSASNSSDAESLIDAFFKNETDVVDLGKVEDVMDAAVLFKDLYPAYEDFCRSQGAEPLGDAAFSEKASKRGHYKRHKQGGEAYCVGIKLRRKR